MGLLGAFLEPLVVVVLLFGGTWVNRNKQYLLFAKRRQRWAEKWSRDDEELHSPESLPSPSTSDPLLSDAFSSLLAQSEARWRYRDVKIGRRKVQVITPNTSVFKDYFLSRLLLKFPFLVEVWYWALIYWVYQLGRAFTAVSLREGTVDVARRHALQVIHLEQRLQIFWEPAIQAAFVKHELLMQWINRIYSFIHIPGSILFLVVLYYYTSVRNRVAERRADKPVGELGGSPAGPQLYEARRRTMAICNLLAFVVFTAWPCMPPRLLSDKSVGGDVGREAQGYGFIDTVHGPAGESSVWTQNKFCNQYAAMPSLHFGYALMIGVTIATIPLAPRHRQTRSRGITRILRSVSPTRLLCVLTGFSYAFIILVAIVSTANHFILDAVAGTAICIVGWLSNRLLLNLLPLEDYFLWCVRIHKPQAYTMDMDNEGIPGKGVIIAH